MVPSLEERRRRFRRLAETHPGLVVASMLVEDVRTNARPKRQAAPLNRNGNGKPDPRSEGSTQLQFALWAGPKSSAAPGR